MADELTGYEGQEQDAGKQIRRILRAAKENRFRLIVLSAVGMILGGFIGTMIPDIYESRTLLLLRERKLVDESRLIRAIEDKPLAQKEQTLEQELRSFSWIVQVLERVEWVEYSQVRRDPAKRKDLVEQVRDPDHFEVDVATDPAGELLVEIIFKWFDAQKAHDFVRAARKNWISHRDEESKAYARHQLDGYEVIVRERKVAYENALAARESFMTENGLSLLNDINADAGLKAELVRRHSQAESDLSKLDTQLKGYQERIDNEEPFFILENKEPNPLYDAARAQLQLARSNLNALKAKKKDTHPDVQKARTQLTSVQTAFDNLAGQEFLPTEKNQVPNDAYTELKKAIDLATPTLSGLKDELQSLDRQLAAVTERLSRLPTLQNTLERLTNDFTVAQEQYNEAQKVIAPYRDKVKQWENRSARLFADSEEELQDAGAFEILEDPVVADAPIGLPKPVYSVMGLFAGLAIGLLLSLLSEVSRSTYDDAGEVQSTLDLPVLGSVTRIATELELRKERVAEVVRMAGSVLIVASLGVVVYVVTAHPDVLPLRVQDVLENMRSTFR